MSYLEIVDRVLERQRNEEHKPQTDITLLPLSEIAKRNIAIEIFSEILDCSIWLCSNELIALQIKEDYPEAIAYTVDEVIELLKLNPSLEDVRRIHNTKRVFPRARVIIDGYVRGRNNED